MDFDIITAIRTANHQIHTIQNSLDGRLPDGWINGDPATINSFRIECPENFHLGEFRPSWLSVGIIQDGSPFPSLSFSLLDGNGCHMNFSEQNESVVNLSEEIFHCFPQGCENETGENVIIAIQNLIELSERLNNLQNLIELSERMNNQ